MTPLPQKAPVQTQSGARGKKLDAPMPLSEFAKQSRKQTQHGHTGHGRRDQLTAGERTRILRMLRDEGGRIADEESQVHIGAAPPSPNGYDFDFDDEAAPPPAPSTRQDVPAKPALVVGLAQARNKKRETGGPQLTRQKPPTAAPARPPTPPQPSPRAMPPTKPPPGPRGKRPPLPNPFNEQTRAMQDEELIAAVRSAPGPGRSAPPNNLFDEPTRLGGVDEGLLESTKREQALPPADEYPPKFLNPATEISEPVFGAGGFDDEATRMANVDGPVRPAKPAKPARRVPPPPKGNDERTRAVDIRNDGSINDVDWDID
jgi:hypothetical protein